MRRKIVTCLITGCIIFGLAGCGDSHPSTPAEPTEQQEEATSDVNTAEETPEVQNDSIVNVNKTNGHIEFEYDGFNIVLPEYFELDDSASDDNYLEFAIADGEYAHQAYIMIEKSDSEISNPDDFKDYKQSVAYSYQDSDAHIVLEETDIDISGISALYLSMTSADEELSKMNTGEFYIYNPDNGDVINIYIWDYEGNAEKPSIDDFKEAVSNITKL